MKVQRTIIVDDIDGKPGVTLTVEGENVRVNYSRIKFNPPVVPLSELYLAVMDLRGKFDAS